MKIEEINEKVLEENYTAIEKFEKEFVIKRKEFSITDWSVFKRNLFLDLMKREREIEELKDKDFIKELEKLQKDIGSKKSQKEIMKIIRPFIEKAYNEGYSKKDKKIRELEKEIETKNQCFICDGYGDMICIFHHQEEIDQLRQQFQLKDKLIKKIDKKYDIGFLIEELETCIKKRHYKTEMCMINLGKVIEAIKELESLIKDSETGRNGNIWK